MHRNTAITIACLSIIAALLLGMNVGRKLAGGTNPSSVASNPSPSTSNIAVINSPQPTPLNLTFQIASPGGQVAAAVSTKTYTSNFCGIQFEYPGSFTLNEASNAARLTDKNTQENMDMICGSNFPLPPLPPEKMAVASISGVSAKIFHDNLTENGGKPIDVIIFKHPQNQLDIVLMGFGDAFNALLKSLKLF